MPSGAGSESHQILPIPEGLSWLGATEEGRTWLELLPRVVDSCAERWGLQVGRPYPGAFVSLAMPSSLPDGTATVLKIQFPHRESEHEAAALALWDGAGAVRLLGHDPERHVLLLERCEPGTSLSELEPDAALSVAVALLPRLWRPAGPSFRPLSEEAAWWAGYLPETWDRASRPFERRLLSATLHALETLPASQGEQVLVDQDLHAGNVLRAEREPWLVIDPKPLAGEREFGVAALVRGTELGHGRRSVVYRLDRLTDELELDRDRARGWALAQTIAWAFEDGGVLQEHVESARWLLDA
jgi:streptomycin 6-kinase